MRAPKVIPQLRIKDTTIEIRNPVRCVFFLGGRFNMQTITV